MPEAQATKGRDRKRRSLARKRAVIALLLLAVVAIVLANVTWLAVEHTSVLGNQIVVNVSGHKAAPGLTASGIVIVAAAIFLAISGRFSSYIALAIMGISALSIGAFSVSVLARPQDAIRTTFADATGISTVPDGIVVNLVGPALIAVAIILLAVVIWTWLSVSSWTVSSSRYERTGTAGISASQNLNDSVSNHAPSMGAALDRGVTGRPHDAQASDERALWDSLTLGADPTQDDQLSD